MLQSSFESPLQFEFLLAGTAGGGGLVTEPLGDLREQISARRCLPLGERVHADLRDDTLPWGEGRIELACVPVLPLGPRQLLALRVVTVEFPSRQVVAWSLV